MIREDLQFAPVYRISPNPRGMLAIIDQERREEHLPIVYTSIHILQREDVYAFKNENRTVKAECIVNTEENGVKGHHIFIQLTKNDEYWCYAGYKEGEIIALMWGDTNA